MKFFKHFLLPCVTGVVIGVVIASILAHGGVISYAIANKGAVIAFGGLFVTSGFKTIPPPGTPFDLFTWFYDWGHQFFNLPNNRLNPVPSPQPPLPAPVSVKTTNASVV
jgi:hypothetical protein